jgi:hypothetical protein
MTYVTRALVVLVMCIVGCSKADEPKGAPAQIVDLSASVAELRRELNAHQGEARFLALLAPT